MNHPIQVNIPYSMLLKNLDFILESEINPEIYFDGELIRKDGTFVTEDLKGLNE